MYSGSTMVRAVDDHAIHIPFHVGNRIGRKKPIYFVEEIGANGGFSEVENQLMAAHHRRIPLIGQNPLGVRPKEIGIGADHFRFEPQAEFHVEGSDVVNDWPEPVRPDGCINPPIAEAAMVVATTMKPTIVNDESFDADLGRPIRQSAQRS